MNQKHSHSNKSHQPSPFGLLESFVGFAGILDLDGTLLYANSAPVRETGMSEQDFIGKKFWDCYWWNFSIESQTHLRESVERARLGNISRYETEARMTETKKLILDFQMAPLRDEQGQITHLVASAIDVTARVMGDRQLQKSMQALERNKERLELSIETAGIGSYDYSIGDDSPIWTSHLHKLYGISENAPINLDFFHEWLHPEDRPAFFKLLSEATAPEADIEHTFEFRLIRPSDGQTRWFLDRGQLIKENGVPVRMIGTVQDITQTKEAAIALRRQSDLLQKVVENSPFPSIIHAEDGEILQVNKAWTQLSGYESSELPNIREWALLAYGEDLSHEREEFIEKLFDRGQLNHNGEFEINCADGSKRIWDFYSAAVGQDEKGRRLVLSSAADITDKKATEKILQQKQQEFQSLANSIPQLAWMGDADGNIFWYNQRWFDFTGTTLEEVYGWGWTKVHHPDHVERVVKKLSNCFRKGVAWEDTFPMKCKEGDYRWFLSRAYPVRDQEGKVQRWFGTNTDVTEQRKTNEELRQLTAQLSEAHRKKDEFLATLAHELRNPLAAIHSGVELLEEAMKDEELAGTIRSIIDRQTTHLTALVDDLLDVSRITVGKLNLRKKRVDLQEILRDALESVHPMLVESKHEIDLDIPPTKFYLIADPHRMTQVFVNLLNNAVKYTPTGGRISLKVEACGEQVAVTVKDTGVGIAEEMLESVFEMFTQIEQKLEKNQSGLGLGLTLVKSMVQMHGGKVVAKSDGQSGSEFVVYLPLQKQIPESDISEESTPLETQIQQKLVLVADDNEDAAALMTMRIRKMGHQVLTAHNGADALDMAEKFLPDVVMMDLGMPVMSGYEAAQKIRATDWGRNILLVAVTGWGQEKDKVRTQEVGFDAHIIKPARSEILKKLLDEKSSLTA